MTTAADLLVNGWNAYQSGNYAQAEEFARQCLQASPSDAYAFCLLGAVCHAHGKPTEAIHNYLQALRINPDYADAHNNLGVAFAQQGKVDQAIASFQQAVQSNPNYAEALNNLGNALRMSGRFDEAIATLQRALRVNPSYVEAYNNLGLALSKLERLPEAEQNFRKAVQFRPEQTDLHNNVGVCLLQQGKLAEAVSSFQEALRLQPGYIEAHNNLGYTFRNQGRFTEALACFEKTLQLNPEHAGAHHNRSLIKLLRGELEEGWAEYEWRWKCPEFTLPPFRKPLWDGSDFTGKRILLHTEQGIGDSLQFVRYALLVKARGGTVWLACPQNLVQLLSTCKGIDRVLAKGGPIPDFEIHAPLLSLPHILKTTRDAIPAGVPYLFAEPSLIEKWRQELNAMREFKIGICWQGSPQYREDRFRSFPLAYFEPIARVEGIRLYSLQKGPGTEQLRTFGGRFPVTDLGTSLDQNTGAFVETAAVLKNLDLVISADSALGHLAGALGVPAWLAIPFVPDWRWTLYGETTPWYPTVRLFRQSEFDKWQSVFARMAAELQANLAGRPHGTSIKVHVAPGELLDKITILEIKSERISDAAKLRNVRLELGDLEAVCKRSVRQTAGLAELKSELKSLNEQLWQTEDDIRLCEREQDFGKRFVKLARSVYRTNDQRSQIKRRIDELLGSPVREEKSYAPYQAD
jgi:tetratricopeptide (TPR) repeat protein